MGLRSVWVKLLCSPKIIAHQQRQLFIYSSKKVQTLQRQVVTNYKWLLNIWNVVSLVSDVLSV